MTVCLSEERLRRSDRAGLLQGRMRAKNRQWGGGDRRTCAALQPGCSRTARCSGGTAAGRRHAADGWCRHGAVHSLRRDDERGQHEQLVEWMQQG